MPLGIFKLCTKAGQLSLKNKPIIIESINDKIAHNGKQKIIYAQRDSWLIDRRNANSSGAQFSENDVLLVVQRCLKDGQ